VVLALALSLAACNRGSQNIAIRQGVLDHLTKMGMNTNAMDVSLTTVEVKGTQADATASIALKGNSGMPAMTRKYHLEEQGSQWVVTSSQDAGANPHGAAAPGAANPHGGGAMPANPHEGGAVPGGGSSKMPSPGDLPPSKPK
jgi:hypothetical protein